MKQRGAIAIGLAVAAGLAGYVDGARAQMSIQRASVTSAGEQGDGWSSDAALSGDGRYVAFQSYATNLVAGDTNGLGDIFVHDLVTGATERVNLNSNEGQTTGGGGSWEPTVSQDGRFVAFWSDATNLDPADTDPIYDIFVRDRTGGTTELISVASDETKGNGYSYSPSISGEGRYVAFHSSATNLVAGDNNGRQDVFVRDRTGGTTELVSVSSDEVKGTGDSFNPSISADGRYVAFTSSATNLHPLDANTDIDIFVRDRIDGTTVLASVSSAGEKGNSSSQYPTISADGRYVSFVSGANNLVTGDTNNASDVFVRDLQQGSTERVSIGDGEEEGNSGTIGYGGGISSDGRYVVFPSDATNLVADDTNSLPDVFRRDRTAGETLRVNLNSTGTQMTDGYFYESPVIAGNGMVIAFVTGSTTLVAGETGTYDDVFVVTMAHYTLNVTLAGTGAGTVNSNPAGIDCGTDCAEAYASGTGVTLTATPAAGSTFRGWSGDADCTDGSVSALTGTVNCVATFGSSFPWIMFNNILTGEGKK
jgi:Tol biopolymer transport system component